MSLTSGQVGEQEINSLTKYFAQRVSVSFALGAFFLSQRDRGCSCKFAILSVREAHRQNRKFNGPWRRRAANERLAK